MKNDDEMSAAFLAQLGRALKTRKGVDAELAGIVVEHILTPAPAEDCVEQAMTAVNTLAAARATTPKENADG
ncbi:MAG: hypothetical protein MIO92_11860 [Methanosarcinaceae archaeon]|nr:hypothetical protein [Methanosarcinaceae archaeon]